MIVDFVKGDDAGAGTWESPFRTLQHALAVRHEGDIIVIACGDEPITLNGAIPPNTVFMAYPQEKRRDKSSRN